ncbi:transposable element Tcb2 transposase [Trichonephila clavipes]|nr:transposable element Tcb2 transposase [Trichonephila clavipes]
MDVNAWPHWTLVVEELLESEDITRMDWTAYSPDLNPIEHLWDALGRRIVARLLHPENTQQLKQMLIEEWALLSQEMLHQLVLSMRRRCEATIADCYLELSAIQHNWTMASQLARDLVAAFGRRISRQKINNRLAETGLYARYAVRCVPLTAPSWKD